MCGIFNISRSSYYKWERRVPGKREQRKEEITSRIKEIHKQSYQTYGSPRIRMELKRMGIECSKKTVARIMRENRIVARSSVKYKKTTKVDKKAKYSPNVIQGKFSVKQSNQLWLSDITYISTKEGWLYLAAVMDAYSRKIIGWSAESNLSRNLVIEASRKAFTSRKPEKELIFHSDRGCQYSANDFRELLKNYETTQSMSGSGNCYDNAMMESFFHSLKSEFIYHYNFNTRNEAKNYIFEYIELFYNRKRLHSALGFLSPLNFELLSL